MRLLKFIPKGTIVHEILSLPQFWIKLSQISTAELEVAKIRYGTHSRQYMLRIAPLDLPDGGNKAVVYFHGGGWRFGKPEFFFSNAKVLASAGYTVYLPSVRRIPMASYAAIRMDLNAVLRSVLDDLKTRDAFPAKMVLGGMSAGGNLAALAVLDEEARKGTGLTRNDFSGLFLCGAPLNLRQMAPSIILRGFAGPRDGALFSEANPFEQLSGDEHLPVLCIHGEKDGLVAFRSAVSFVEKLKQINIGDTVFEVIPEGTHLDACSWAHENNLLRGRLLEWLDRYCTS